MGKVFKGGGKSMEIKERGKKELLQEILNELKKQTIFDLMQLRVSKVLFVGSDNREIAVLLNQKKAAVNVNKKLLRSIRMEIRDMGQGKGSLDLNKEEEIVDIRPPRIVLPNTQNKEVKKDIKA